MAFSRACEVQMPCMSDFSREEEDFWRFSPHFRSGGYYRNPVNFGGLKSRNFCYTLELLKKRIYRISDSGELKAESRKSAELSERSSAVTLFRASFLLLCALFASS
jgi:hypothetical protein